MGTYMDISKSLGGAKKKLLSWKDFTTRWTVWPQEHFSKEGKKVWIKSVASMLSTYVMSWSRLPS